MCIRDSCQAASQPARPPPTTVTRSFIRILTSGLALFHLNPVAALFIHAHMPDLALAAALIHHAPAADRAFFLYRQVPAHELALGIALAAVELAALAADALQNLGPCLLYTSRCV